MESALFQSFVIAAIGIGGVLINHWLAERRWAREKAAREAASKPAE